MKKNLLILPLLFAGVLNAQSFKGIYEITDPGKTGFDWQGIKSLELAENNVILKNTREKTKVYGAFKAEAIDRSQPIPTNAAALAYDETSNRLYYVTMHTGQLRYIKLNARNLQHFTEIGTVQDLTTNNQTVQLQPQNQGPVITRLTTGNNNYGYGLSNDGKTFFKFSLNNKTEIKQLGSLTDDPKNGNISIHNMATSWGGDMVADADGNLYVISAYQYVFKINTTTKVATYITKISGLQPQFTVNGAAVTEDGDLLLSSANYLNKRAIVKDFDTWNATFIDDINAGSSSDLASPYLLFAKKITEVKDAVKPVNKEKLLQAYPNPTSAGFTNIAISDISGDVTIELFDANGSAVTKNVTNSSVKNQSVRVNTSTLSKGTYLVKITDNKTKETFNSKIVVQ